MKIKMLPVVLGLFFTGSCWGANLNVINTTDWSVKVTYQEGQNKPIEVVLRGKGSFFTIPKEKNITKLSFITHGKYLSFGAQSYDLLLALEGARKVFSDKPAFNIYIGLEEGFFGAANWKVYSDDKPLSVQLPATNNPFDAFPGVRARILAVRPISPQHILGVDSGASPESINAAYKYLLAKWNPKDFPKSELPTFIKKIIETANTEGLKGKWDFTFNIPEFLKKDFSYYRVQLGKKYLFYIYADALDRIPMKTQSQYLNAIIDRANCEIQKSLKIS